MSELEGISFIARIRDEENTLYESINSLSQLKIPHEIILILHLCTDNSPQIAEKLANENPNVKVLFYNTEVSRAGYETLATDDNSEHSLMTYYNWCFKQRKYPWAFKWDADCIPSDSLIQFLNENTWEKKNIHYTITHKNDEMINKEPFLMCTLIKYVKYVFWEAPFITSNSKSILLNEDIYLEHMSKFSTLKKYWMRTPWYENENSEEAIIVKNRILKLNSDFGIEPKGLARACNKECRSFTNNIFNKKPEYVNLHK